MSAQYKTDFVELQDKFGDMFDELQKNVKLRVQVDDLKQYLCSRFRELKTVVQDADTTNEIMTVVQNECTLAEYSYLKKIAEHFKLEEAKTSIELYRSKLDDFCKHTLKQHSYAKSFCVDHPEPIVPSSNKIEVTFKLEWNAEEKSLKDVRDVLRMVFGDLTDRVQIVVIKDGSVVVVCWAPRYLMQDLVKLAKSKLDQVKKNGVVEITVGHCNIDSITAEKVNRYIKVMLPSGYFEQIMHRSTFIYLHTCRLILLLKVYLFRDLQLVVPWRAEPWRHTVLSHRVCVTVCLCMCMSFTRISLQWLKLSAENCKASVTQQYLGSKF